jgi:hypothetical protein
MGYGEKVFAFRGQGLSGFGVRGYDWGLKVLHDGVAVSLQALLQITATPCLFGADCKENPHKGVDCGTEQIVKEQGRGRACGSRWTNGIYVHHGAAFFKVSFWAILSFLGRAIEHVVYQRDTQLQEFAVARQRHTRNDAVGNRTDFRHVCVGLAISRPNRANAQEVYDEICWSLCIGDGGGSRDAVRRLGRRLSESTKVFCRVSVWSDL